MKTHSICMTLAVVLVAQLAAADSLFTPAAARKGSLVAEPKAEFEVGDIIRVLVRENIDASTQANTDTKKESSIEADASPADNTFLTADGPSGLNIMPGARLPNWDIEVENEHKAAGATKRSNKLTTTVSCFVTNVHPNGNVDIEGEREVTVNREDSTLYVSGTIRARDVTASNSISSDQIANAVVRLRGRGPLWNTERRGILTKLLDWFSPF